MADIDAFAQMLSEEVQGLRIHLDDTGVGIATIILAAVVVRRDTGEYDVRRSLSASGVNLVTGPLAVMGLNEGASLVLQAGLNATS